MASTRPRSQLGSAWSPARGGVVWTDEGGLEGRERQLVDAQGPGHRMPAEAGDEVGATGDDPRLRAAEELVAAGGHDVGAVAEHRGHVGLAREKCVGREQAGADVDHQRDAQPGQVGDRHRR